MRLIERLALAAALALAIAPAARAQDKTFEWKYSHWVPPTHPLHGILLDWAKSIDAASKGTIKVSVFPAQQLGKAFDHYDMVQKGIADVAYISTGYQTGRMLVSGAGQLPFIISNAEGGSRAFDEWYRPYAAKDMPGVKYIRVGRKNAAKVFADGTETPIGPAISSSAYGAASRTGGASPPDTTNSPPTTWPASSSPLQSPSGAIESRP